MSEQRAATAPITQTDPETEFADLDVDAPRVGIIMGSKSDMAEMEKAGDGPRGAAASATRSASCRPTATPTRSPSTAGTRGCAGCG